MRVTACAAEGAGRVVLAVGAGKNRNDDPRRCQTHGGSHALVGGAVMLKCRHKLTGLAVGENRLKLGLPQLLQAGQVNVAALGLQRIIHGGKAEKLAGGSVQ